MASPEIKSPSRAQAWFCTTGLPSDVVVEVADVTFHLHKFPLMSKSKKLFQLITEQEGSESGDGNRRDGGGDVGNEEEGKKLRIALPNIPGGAEAFETAAKFCYGIKIELTPSNAVLLHCAAEHLGMAEDLTDDNLISQTDRYISKSICRSVRDSVKALCSCGELPMANELGIVQKCVDAIAAMAADSSSLFGWAMEDGSTGMPPPRLRIDVGREPAVDLAKAVLPQNLCDELTLLNKMIFGRVIAAMIARDLNPGIIEGCLLAYASKSIPGLSRSERMCGGRRGEVSADEQIELLEMVISILPEGRTAETSSGSVRLLFGMLRIANILGVSDDARETLERKIGTQLDLAVIDDLLMANYSSAAETLYDVDCVERLLSYFLEGNGNAREGYEDEELVVAPRSANPLAPVAKLLDHYLSEISTDVNLQPEKFCNLALALPEGARVYDDGLYRAIDIYLQAHPRLTESQREKLCCVMDSQKLTVEACTHAAQNERLPLRAIVQVLFFEQLQLRHTIAGSLHARGVAARPLASARTTWDGAAADGRDQVLRLDMDTMRNRVSKLERECSTLKKAIEKIGRISARASLSRRLGCKFRTQVCDSHDRTIVEATKSRASEQPRQSA